MKRLLELRGILGVCGDRKVFLGFATARTLASVSFPDVLDEATGRGYQRRFHREHSLEFKKYIQKPGASTISLTFNLRPEFATQWWIEGGNDGEMAILKIEGVSSKVMAQVDCQHRLGYLEQSDTPFAFMAFIGLTVPEEIDIFRVINGKAKGLSGSLLDFTEARISGDDLRAHKPELFIALRLHEDQRSPWFGKLDLGGTPIVGNLRQASLRTMQKAVKRYLREVRADDGRDNERDVTTIIYFWRAISLVLAHEWNQPRQHMLTKGIGVYCLMSLAGVMVAEAEVNGHVPELDYFISRLSDFIDRIDWSNNGPLKGFGGASGADAAFTLLMRERETAQKTRHSNVKQEYFVN